jgi:hypothetical protein
MSKNGNNSVLWIAGVSVIFTVLFFAYQRRRKSIAIAKAFIGQQELSGNTGFKSAEMQKLMSDVGWRSGDAWCVYFAKLVWFMSAPNFLKPKIKQAISGSSQQTWHNVNNDPAFVVSRIPRPGDMVIWQNYKSGNPQWSGHAGIVQKVGINSFQTIEGNTAAGEMSNEGIEVATRDRAYNFDNNNGLRLKGFVRLA